MTVIDTTSVATKLEESSPRTTLLGLSPVDTPPRRAWSLGTLDDTQRQTRKNLPDLIATSNKLASKRANKSYKAAVRASAVNMRVSTSRSPITASGLLRSPTDSITSPNSGTRRPHLNPISPTHSHSQPNSTSPVLASGPAAGLQQPPGTYESIEQINNRFNRQTASLPIYLIRTDLRYVPAQDTVTVYMELPGLRLEDVSLKIGNRSNGIRHLVVTAISRPPTHARDEMAMQERVFGVFSRTLIVPPHVQASDIKAEMANGLLILQIPGTKFESITIQARQ